MKASRLQLALRFIEAVRSDHGMRTKLEKLGPDVTEDDLIGLARECGFDIGVDEFRRAHAVDWHMRQARYARRA